YREARQKVREESTNFIEVFVNAPLQVCADRDVKGMYAKAFAGEIKEFTGVSDPYEEPEKAEIVIHTDQESVEDSVGHILGYLENRGLIPATTQETSNGRV
ncbi:MAG: adenylyl-sulfate kinase, partial [Burkholderiales bacterium]|nr:adenylyl-sulfate kinase [Anaerolineae bacterium]